MSEGLEKVESRMADEASHVKRLERKVQASLTLQSTILSEVRQLRQGK